MGWRLLPISQHALIRVRSSQSLFSPALILAVLWRHNEWARRSWEGSAFFHPNKSNAKQSIIAIFNQICSLLRQAHDNDILLTSIGTEWQPMALRQPAQDGVRKTASTTAMLQYQLTGMYKWLTITLAVKNYSTICIVYSYIYR